MMHIFSSFPGHRDPPSFVSPPVSNDTGKSKEEPAMAVVETRKTSPQGLYTVYGIL